MAQAWLRGEATAVALCKELFPPQVAVGVLDVAPQLVALLRRHLAGPVRTALPLTVGVTHIVPHALALVVAHRAVLAPLALAALLGVHRRGAQRESDNERKDLHGRPMISLPPGAGVTIGNSR